MSAHGSARLFLVRHAETAHNAHKVLRGKASADDPISGVGERQAAACAAALAALNLPDPKVYASRYRRAQQTAEPVARALGVSVNVLDGVQEMDTGNWNGRPYSDMEQPASQICHPDGTFGFEGGESVQMVAQRVRVALAEALAQGGTPIIVSHGLALQVMLGELLGVPFDEAWNDQRFAHRNTAISEMLGEGGAWRAVSIGGAAHLDALR